MKSVFERLLKHCEDVYSGKTGRNGIPYILHLREVEHKVYSWPEKIVALAHDYGEFRDINELAEIGVPAVLLDKIRLLAKTFPYDIPEIDPQYCDYIWNLLADPVCCQVKYADLLVNNGYEDSPAGDGRRFPRQYPNVMNLLADAADGKLYFKYCALYVDIFSNFYYGEPLEIDGKIWRSGYEFYWNENMIACGVPPGENNRFCMNTMAAMLNVKFAIGTLAHKRLMQTGNLKLINLSDSDLFWGANRKGEGENILGKALMQMRNCGSLSGRDLFWSANSLVKDFMQWRNRGSNCFIVEKKNNTGE